MGTSYSLGQFIVGRIFIGLGTGAIVATVPIWQVRGVPRAESRGGHVSSMGIYCGSGLSMALWIAFGLSFTTGEVTWRFSNIGLRHSVHHRNVDDIHDAGESAMVRSGFRSSESIVSLLTIALSYRRLKKKERHQEAKQVLELLHPGSQETVDKEIEDIELALKVSANHASLSAMFAMGPQRIFHRVMLASVVQIMLAGRSEC